MHVKKQLSSVSRQADVTFSVTVHSLSKQTNKQKKRIQNEKTSPTTIYLLLSFFFKTRNSIFSTEVKKVDRISQ